MLPLGEWAMLTYTYTDGKVSIYVNGVYPGVIEMEIPLPLTLIGGDAPADQGGKGWQIDPKMSMDDLWIYGKALTEAEIMNLYTTNSAAEEPAEEVVEEPVVEETVEAPAETTAPQTSDSMIFALVVICLLGTGAVVSRKIRA